MSQVYLINLATVAEFEDISTNISAARMVVYVKKAQDLDLKLFMGQAFYTDFIKYFSNDPTTGALVIANDTPQPYKDLFTGLTYTDKAGNQVAYDGIIPTLVYWTFARFVENDYVQYTKTGPVVKEHEAGNGLEPKDITRLVQQHRSVANAHCNDIELFLYNNWSNYPLWRWDQRKKSGRQSGPRIRSVDATAYNAPGIGGNNNYPGYNGFDWFS